MPEESGVCTVYHAVCAVLGCMRKKIEHDRTHLMMFYDVLWPSEVIRIIQVYGVLRGPGHHSKLLKANMPPPAQSAQI